MTEPTFHPDSAADQPLGLGRLARTLRRRSLDLVAIGALMGVCLAFGETLSQWWAASSPNASMEGSDVPNPRAASALSESLTFEFGAMPVTVTRQEFAGDLSLAWAKLTELCRDHLVNAPADSFASDKKRIKSIGLPLEQRVLQKLAELTATATVPGHGQIFHLEGAVPTVVAVRSPRATQPVPRDQSTNSPGRTESESSQDLPASASGRLACWGMALPAEGKNWTLYLFDPLPASATAAIDRSPGSLPLPAGGRRILCVTESDGARLEAFAGSGRTGDWAGHFRNHLLKQGWSTVSQQRDSRSWTGHFARTAAGPDETCQVHIHTSAAGIVSGVASLTGRPSGLLSRGAE